MDPANPDVLYACLWRARQGPWEDGNRYGGAGGGIFKSTDGGNTWNKLAGGLPEDLVQAYVAIAPSDPQRLYSSLATTHETHIYRSDDAGEHWTQITTDTRPALRIGGGDLAVPKVDPKNPDVVYTTSIVTLALDRRRQDLDRHSRRAGRRRLPEHLDQPRQSQHDSAGERSGRHRHRERRRNVEFLVQPADGAALPRHHRQCVSLSRLRRASRRAAPWGSRAAATTAKSPSASGTRWA